MMNSINKSLLLHEKKHGKLGIKSLLPLKNRHDLSLIYTPGVALPCNAIFHDKNLVYKYTWKARSVAIITDGSAVLGLGNIGAEAALPVMEGKCILLKKFANIDAVPICLATQDSKKIIETIINISSGFGGILLEDISAPRCFQIENELKKRLNIPVFHDDQHGTAIVCLAGLLNSFKLRGTDLLKAKIVIVGAGAAGSAIAYLLKEFGIKNLLILDSKGIISKRRKDLNPEKKLLAQISNPNDLDGNLETALLDADAFIGVSKANILTQKLIKKMAKFPIIFALANPVPEIDPLAAKKGGAFIIATGRSDFPNQINNVLAFPGIFKAALKLRNIQIDKKMMLRAALALASSIKTIKKNRIIPSIFNKKISEIVASAVLNR